MVSVGLCLMYDCPSQLPHLYDQTNGTADSEAYHMIAYNGDMFDIHTIKTSYFSLRRMMTQSNGLFNNHTNYNINFDI